MMASKSYAHLRKVTEEYKRLSGHSLKKTIRAEFKGAAALAMSAIRECL